MVKFYLAQGDMSTIQKLLDIWSNSHPDAIMEDVELSYTIDDSGKLSVILVSQEE